MKTRRAALCAIGAGAVMGGAARAASSVERDATRRKRETKDFVLVHGTWHGGWVWQPAADRLRAAGHRVWAPTCTGCGERSHLATPDVGLATHVQDIVSVIECEEIERPILVGHSFAGLTITGVADRLRERPAAILPEPDGRYAEFWEARRRKFIDGYLMNFWDEYSLDMLVPPTDALNVALLKRRLTPHPARQWTDRLEWRNGGWEGLPRTYFQPTLQTHSPSPEFMVGPARAPGWDFVRLPCYRDGMLTHPDEVAAAFAALA